MKHFAIFSLALGIASAHATGKPEPTPVPTPSVSGSQAQAQSQNATATAGAVGVGVGGSSTATGTGGQSSSTSGGSYSALSEGSTSTRIAVLPQPVWTMVPQAAGCITTSARSASVGWSLISVAKSDQQSDPACVGIIMAKAAYDHCHFESEQMIMARVYETVFPGAPALPMVPGARNHSLAECEDMKRPRLVMTPTIAPVAPAPEAPARAPKVDRQ